MTNSMSVSVDNTIVKQFTTKIVYILLQTKLYAPINNNIFNLYLNKYKIVVGHAKM